MNYDVEITSFFAKQAKRLAKKYPSLKQELQKLVESLLLEPSQGVSLGGDCYKIRMAISSKGKGKSGGARVITHVKVVNKKVYLMSIYDKSEHENISDEDIDNLLSAL